MAEGIESALVQHLASYVQSLLKVTRKLKLTRIQWEDRTKEDKIYLLHINAQYYYIIIPLQGRYRVLLQYTDDADWPSRDTPTLTTTTNHNNNNSVNKKLTSLPTNDIDGSRSPTNVTFLSRICSLYTKVQSADADRSRDAASRPIDHRVVRTGRQV